MKFYKLELINREQSYNQMFGTNPNVGLLSVGVGGKPMGKGGNVAAPGMPPLGNKSMSVQPKLNGPVGTNNMMSQKDIIRQKARA